MKIVGSRWLYKLKEGIENVESKKIKARLIARGYTKVEDIHYNEVFSLVIKYNSIRLLLPLLANFDMYIEQMDVKTTFQHGVLEKKLYEATIEV